MTRREYEQRARELALRGEALPQSKLTTEQARAIRARHVPFSRTHGAPAIARDFGLHVRTVEKVLAYASWVHA